MQEVSLLMRTTIIKIISILCIFLPKESIAQTVTTLTEPFSASGGVSVDTDGIIYVADFGTTLNNANGTIVYKVTLDGEVTEFASGLTGASGNEFDSNGNLFQANIAISRISKITPDGTVSEFAASNIINPVGVTVDKFDNVYSTNCKAPGDIIKTTPAGSSTVFASNKLLDCPNGLTIDDDGNLYTANFSNGDIIKISQGGDVSKLATLPGEGNGHLIFGNERLYVVARRANQIYEVSLNGDIRLLAGTGTTGNTDGDALETTWFIPNGIGISPSGTELFINDKVLGTGTQLNPIVVRMISGIDTTLFVSVDEESYIFPSDYSLSNAYPNPFNPKTVIEYSLSKSAEVSLIVYTLQGEEVTRLVNGGQNAGSHKVTWDASRTASGVYLYRLRAGEFVQTRKMVLLK